MRLDRRRTDAGSINGALGDTRSLGRAHAVGKERQHVNVLACALTVGAFGGRIGRIGQIGRRIGSRSVWSGVVGSFAQPDSVPAPPSWGR